MRDPGHVQLALPPARAALLLVDLQEEQRSDPDYSAHDIEQVLQNAARLLGTARQTGWPVAHAQYIRDFDAVPPRPYEARAEGGGPTFSAAGSGLTDICAEVAPTGGEPVFTKNDASAFDGTGLEDWLQGADAEWLIVCGIWTEACVAATVRDAMAKGFRVLLVKDACGSGSRLMHETAILNLANRLYGGGVCDTARTLSLLRGTASRVWRIGDPVPYRFTDAAVSDLYAQL